MGWTVLCFTNTRRRTGPPVGKRGMVRVGGSASRTISEDNTPDPGGGHHPAWKRHRASPTWRVSLRRNRIAAIVQCRTVLRLWGIEIQTWTFWSARRVMGAIRLSVEAVEFSPALAPEQTEITIGTEDQVQQNRRSCFIGSRRAFPPDSGGGGGDVYGGSGGSRIGRGERR